jgi:hypothetical protein
VYTTPGKNKGLFCPIVSRESVTNFIRQGKGERRYGMLGAEGRMIAERPFLHKKIACTEIILNDNSVFSRQSLVISNCNRALLTPAYLVEGYLAFLRKCTFFIIQPVQAGGKTAFALFGSLFPLLIFSGPEFSGNDRTQSAILRVEGGMLVQRNECGKGMLSFIIENVEEGVQVAVEVCDYCPLFLGGRKPSKMRKWFYRCTQAFVHRIITVRFLAHLYKQLEGLTI